MVYNNVNDFAVPVQFELLSGDEDFKKGQIGKLLQEANDLDGADLVLLGCAEQRGDTRPNDFNAADAIRQQFYRLYYWHDEVKIADAGNVLVGKKLNDSYAALEMVVSELTEAGKKVLVLGGGHDLTLAIYRSFAAARNIIEATVVDALIDIDTESMVPSESFLLEMLTGQPNYIQQFNLLGFQSYFTYPGLLEAIDKLRFDCVRVGRVQERMDEVEPIIRSSHLLSFDLKALANAYLPVNRLTPNGFTGQEACKLMQYAGLSSKLQVAGIFGLTADDAQHMSSMQVAHMIWYMIDGIQKAKHEAALSDRSGFTEFHTICAEVDTLFLQSRHTGRWWMQMPDGSFAPCSYTDYMMASHNDLPERWLRLQERS